MTAARVVLVGLALCAGCSCNSGAGTRPVDAPEPAARSAQPSAPTGWSFSNAHPYPYVDHKPAASDVAGTYVLMDQTIVGSGLSPLQGRTCTLDLRSDGSVAATDYPNWREAVATSSSKYDTFISTTGRWELGSVGVRYDGSAPKDIWGARFSSDGTGKIDDMAIVGQAPPYELVAVLGDPDSNQVLRFKRK